MFLFLQDQMYQKNCQDIDKIQEENVICFKNRDLVNNQIGVQTSSWLSNKVTLNPKGSTSHIVIPTLILAKISTSDPYNC